MLAQREVNTAVNSQEDMEKLMNPDKMDRPDAPPMTSS
jgi:hypothetical protein